MNTKQSLKLAPTDAQIAELAVECGLPYGLDTWAALKKFAYNVPCLTEEAERQLAAPLSADDILNTAKAAVFAIPMTYFSDRHGSPETTRSRVWKMVHYDLAQSMEAQRAAPQEAPQEPVDDGDFLACPKCWSENAPSRTTCVTCGTSLVSTISAKVPE